MEEIQIESKLMQDLAASIICNQLALHYNEELKNYPALYKHNLKKYLNLTIKELIRAEEKEFDIVDNEAEEVTHQVSSNLMTYVDFMVKGGFTNFMMLANMQYAWNKNPKAIEGIVNKVLNS